MTDLTVYPDQLTALSVAQLAALPPAQLAEVQLNLDKLKDWLKETSAKFDAALARRFGDQERAVRADVGKDFGVVHLVDGQLDVAVTVPKRVSWDQAQLAAIARRIAAAGERVEDYFDIEFSVQESRFNHWPTALREQFESARTVKPGKPSYQLALKQEE